MFGLMLISAMVTNNFTTVIEVELIDVMLVIIIIIIKVESFMYIVESFLI